MAYQAKKLLMRTIKQWRSHGLPGWAAHPENQNEEENKYRQSLRKNKKACSKFEGKNEESGTLAHSGL